MWRSFLTWSAVAALCIMLMAASAPRGPRLSVPAPAVPGAAGNITGVAFGAVFAYNGTQASGLYMPGDTFGNTWGNDGTIYSLANDTNGPQGAYNANVLFGKFSTFDSTTAWSVINTMAAWGTITQNTGSPPASHKTGGLLSVAGNLYTFGWRLDQANGAVGYDGILLKSTDHNNWSPAPVSAAPYTSGQIMWPGYDYPIGWVQYEQDYTCAAGPCPDNANNYVYAIVRTTSPTVLGNPRLARVRIDHIANQAVGDWTYYKGPNGADGMLDANWDPALANAFTIPFAGNTNSGVSIQYLPRYNQYVTFKTRNTGTNDNVWDCFTAFHPWGPWTLLATSPHYNPQALSFQFIMNKSLINGGQQLTVAASSSNFSPATCSATTYYCPYLVPMTFSP